MNVSVSVMSSQRIHDSQDGTLTPPPPLHQLPACRRVTPRDDIVLSRRELSSYYAVQPSAGVHTWVRRTNFHMRSAIYSGTGSLLHRL